MKRLGWISAALLVLLVAAVPYLPAGVFRWSIQRALERGLGRQVEAGDVHFTFFPGPFPGPGFTLDSVTIHEDPRAGIEPFAHVETLGARVRILSLFRRKLEFSSLNLEDATVNLVKTDAGPWNFQFLLDTSAATAGAMPNIRMCGGRVNFKFGDTKSVFFFDDADLNVAPASDGSLELRFGGAPSRTDHSAQDFGRFFVRGTTSPGNRRLDFDVELEKSALAETLRLIDPRGFGVHGTIALNAHLSGPPNHLDVSGDLQVADIHRWDLLPTPGSGWQLGFGGTLDLRGEHLDLQSTAPTPDTPVVIRFRAWDFLETPHWDAGADLAQVPLDTLFKIGQHMGAPLPEDLTAEGTVSGSVAYNQQDGMAGRVALRDASLALPDAEALRDPVA
ncbi:MAG: AsmA family protein, partial [Bryobacteraceae bacterium]